MEEQNHTFERREALRSESVEKYCEYANGHCNDGTLPAVSVSSMPVLNLKDIESTHQSVGTWWAPALISIRSDSSYTIDNTYVARILGCGKIEYQYTALKGCDCNEGLPSKSRQPSSNVAQKSLT